MGIVLPDRFVPAAERCGLIVSLGEWVLNEACHQISIWNRTLGRAFFVSINFSSQDLMDDNLISRIQHALSRNHVNPGQLEIEITESSAFRDREQTARVLEKLRELGIRIAIDDFGSGYSSLGYLKSFPVDTLKIDRLFLADLRGSSDAAIASSVISMAHGMNLKVVAEGVENIDQLSFLSEKQCDRYQGFLFSRPLPAHEIEEFIRDCDIRFSSVNGEDRKD